MKVLSLLFVVIYLLGCSPEATDERVSETPFEAMHPYVVATDSSRERVDRALSYEAGASLLTDIEASADAAFEEPSGDEWDAGLYGDYAFIAETNAFLIWYTRDCSRSNRVIEAIERLATNWEDHSGWGINIKMPAPLMHFASTWDFMQATDCDYQGAEQELAEKLVTITEAFYERYVLDPFYREASIGLTQNNHPIRTAAAIGTIGLVFEDYHSNATEWLNWAVSELDYLWGPDGQYVQAGGGVNEGPHYYNFGFAPTVAFFLSLRQGSDQARIYERNCINRSDLDPWTGHGCVDGEPFLFQNPLEEPRFWEILDWSLSLRLPSGRRAPVGDAPLRSQAAGAIFPYFGAPSYLSWDWASNPEEPYKVKGYHRLAIQHLAYADFDNVDEVPPWTNLILPESGVATLRTGWTSDDLMLSIWGESGSARKAIHNHVDSTSIVFAGLGELFITDTGYYKPNTQDNALTAQPSSHNVILIDGEGAPKKGLLTNWGDADARIENSLTDSGIGYVEVLQSYQEHDVRRFAALLRERYAIVGELLSTESEAQHIYTRRFHTFAGDDLGGETSSVGTNFKIVRPSASLDVYSESSQGPYVLQEPPLVEGRPPHVHKLISREGHHDVFDGSLTGNAPSFLSVLVPSNTERREVAVSLLRSGDGVIAYRLVGDNFDDLIVVNRLGMISLSLEDVGGLQTDAEVVWIGLSDGTRLQRGGTQLTLGNRDLLCQNTQSALALCKDDR